MRAMRDARAALAARGILEADRWLPKLQQLAAMDPVTGQLSVYHDGVYEPHHRSIDALPFAATSKEWYTGWRDHLEFATILAGTPAAARQPATHA